MHRITRWLTVPLIAACLGMSGGCSCFGNLRGDKTAPEESSAYCGQLRPPDKDIEFWGFSNKAREIEKNLGAQ